MYVAVRDGWIQRLQSRKPALFYTITRELWDLLPVLRTLQPDVAEIDRALAPNAAARITIQLWNGGKVAISKDIIEHPFEFKLPARGAEVVGCRIIATVPESLPAELQVSPNGQCVLVAPLLLNPGEGFAFEISFLGHPFEIPRDGDIKPVARVRSLERIDRVIIADLIDWDPRPVVCLLAVWTILGYELLDPHPFPFIRSGPGVILVGALTFVTQWVLASVVFNMGRNAARRRSKIPTMIPLHRR